MDMDTWLILTKKSIGQISTTNRRQKKHIFKTKKTELTSWQNLTKTKIKVIVKLQKGLYLQNVDAMN